MRELSLHILDVLQNAVEAGATSVELRIEEDLTADKLTIVVRDDGRGMTEQQLARIFDPFFTTRRERHVGLGIPLFKAAAERCNGDLSVTSQPGRGTMLRATFQHSHIDRAPLGNVADTLMAIILSQSCELHYLHRRDGRTFEFHTGDIQAQLGDVPFAHPAVRRWLQAFIAEGEEALETHPNDI